MGLPPCSSFLVRVFVTLPDNSHLIVCGSFRILSRSSRSFWILVHRQTENQECECLNWGGDPPRFLFRFLLCANQLSFLLPDLVEKLPFCAVTRAAAAAAASTAATAE